MTKILFKEKNIFAVLKARKNTSKMLTWIKYWIINWRESKFFNKMSKKVQKINKQIKYKKVKTQIILFTINSLEECLNSMEEIKF